MPIVHYHEKSYNKGFEFRNLSEKVTILCATEEQARITPLPRQSKKTNLQ